MIKEDNCRGAKLSYTHNWYYYARDICVHHDNSNFSYFISCSSFLRFLRLMTHRLPYNVTEDPKVVSFPSDSLCQRLYKIHRHKSKSNRNRDKRPATYTYICNAHLIKYIQIYKIYTIEKCNQQFYRYKQTNYDFECLKKRRKKNKANQNTE